MKKKNRIRRICAVILALALAAASLSGCGSQGAPGNAASPDGGSGTPETDKVKIVTTIFPEYDWVMNVLGDNAANAEVTMLLDNGVDLHSYQPTADDILKIATCDLFIYVGGESDRWVGDALREAVNDDMIVMNLMDELGSSLKEEEIVEGMQGEEHEEDEENEEGPEYDEHVWLSLRNAEILVGKIAEAIADADPENAAVYEANAAAYAEKLAALDAEYAGTVRNAPVKTLLFGDRFPFRYLTDDYGLDYYAAFVGCSAETEASFETVTFLAKKADELSLKTVMTIEGSDRRLAETIIANTAAKDLKILGLDSMQAVTAKDVNAGATYIAIMEDNLKVLKEALN